MKILLVIPKDRKPKGALLRDNGLYIPLGIAQIAAVLIQAGHNPKIFDRRLSHDFARTVAEFDPNIIGITSSFFSAEDLIEAAKESRKISKAKIVVGGPYASVHAESLLDNPDIDIIARDDGEQSLTELANGKCASKIRGISYKTKKIIHNPSGNPIDINRLPYPALDLFKFDKYRPAPKHYRKLPQLPMITARGCVYGKCTYCYQPRRYGKRLSPNKAVEQIVYFKKSLGIKEVRFWDDVFLCNKRWVKEFCSNIKSQNIGWSCNARTDTVDEDMVRWAADAGCWQIQYGIESHDIELLRSIKKNTTEAQVRSAVDWTKKTGIETRLSFIIGLPDETPEMTDDTIRFAYSLRPDILQISIATPYPGTAMYSQCKDRLLKHDFCESKAVILPKGYKSLKQVEDKLRQAYRGYYLDPRYIISQLLRLRSLRDLSRNLEGLKMVVHT